MTEVCLLAEDDKKNSFQHQCPLDMIEHKVRWNLYFILNAVVQLYDIKMFNKHNFNEHVDVVAIK